MHETQTQINPSAMDIQQVMSMLPHRYPFLLVDDVSECVPGKRILGTKNVTLDECTGVNRQSICLPRLLVLEALAQVAVVLTFRTLDIAPSGKELIFFAGIDGARFSSDVVPGDRLQLEAEVVRMMPARGIGKFRVVARVAARIVAEAEMMAAMRF